MGVWFLSDFLVWFGFFKIAEVLSLAAHSLVFAVSKPASQHHLSHSVTIRIIERQDGKHPRQHLRLDCQNTETQRGAER